MIGKLFHCISFPHTFILRACSSKHFVGFCLTQEAVTVVFVSLQRFRARPGLRLTVNFLYVMNQRDDDARLSFYDGTSTSSPLLGTFKVSRQGRCLSRPQLNVSRRLRVADVRAEAPPPRVWARRK